MIGEDLQEGLNVKKEVLKGSESDLMKILSLVIYMMVALIASRGLEHSFRLVLSR